MPNLDYEETVNMKEVTGLYKQQFTDQFDLGIEADTCVSPRKGKKVSFLDLFGDPKEITEDQTWETCDNDFVIRNEKYSRTK